MSAERPVIRCEARGWPFDVHGDPAARALLAGVLSSLQRRSGDGPPATRFDLVHDAADPGLWSVRMDGRHMMSAEQLSEALDALIVFVNQSVVLHRDDILSVHAAAVAMEGAAVVMPGASGSGKTTLCARLLQQGASYLTDESVGLTPAGELLGYPKPLGFKAGTLASFTPEELVGLDVRPGPQSVWQVPPSVLTTELATSARPGLLVLPRFTPAEATEIAPVSCPEAAMAVLAQAQNLPAFGIVAALQATGQLVAHSRCLQVRFGDAKDAAARIVELISDPTEGAPGWRLLAGSGSNPASGSVPAPHPTADVVGLCFEDGLLLMRASTGETLSSGAVGAHIWPLLDGTRDVDTVATELAGQFGAPLDRVRADTSTWVEHLIERGFLIPGRARAADGS